MDRPVKRLSNVTPLRLVSKTTPSADALALGRVARGDVSALGELFDRHARPLARFAARAGGARDAEDVVQNTFVRAMTLAPRFDPGAESARPWLFGIAARVILEQRRGFARFAQAVRRLGTIAPGAAPPARTDASDLERALEGLSAAKRVVVVLAEIEGYTCEEIAELVDVPVGTVWTRLHHARKELRAALEGES